MGRDDLTLVGDVLRGRRIGRGAVTVRAGRIAADAAPRGRVLRLPDGWVVSAGLADLQVNGYAGAEVGDDPDALVHVARALARDGVTAFCPTIISRSPRAYARARDALARVALPVDGARSLGPHLEGPFLLPARRGAHARRALRAPAPDEVARVLAFAPRIVTLAPELPGAAAAVRRLRRAGTVVSLGHSEAAAADVRAAVAAGARMVTHALNAMPGLTARGADGLAAALADPRVRVGLIADGVHVGPAVCAALARLLGARLVLVSDAMAAAGAPPGTFALAGRRVASDGVRVTDARGRLAGGAVPLHRGIATLRDAGIGRAAALAGAVTAPRAALGIGDPLAEGAPGDLVLWDADGRPRATLVGGAPCGPAPWDVLGGDQAP